MKVTFDRIEVINLSRILLVFCCFVTSLNIVLSHGAPRQHRVKSSKRVVKYPSDHPLSRHLQYNEEKPPSNSIIFDLDVATEKSLKNAVDQASSNRNLGESNTADQSSITFSERMWAVSSSTSQNSLSNSNQPGISLLGSQYGLHENDTPSHVDPKDDGTPDINELGHSVKSNYQPIRIKAILTEDSGGGRFLTDEERDYLLERVLQPAISAWSNVLSIIQVEDNLVVDKTQLFDQMSCGPGLESGMPSPLVPPEHMTEGIPDTDLVVYVSLSFLKDNEEEDDGTLSKNVTNTSIPLDNFTTNESNLFVDSIEESEEINERDSSRNSTYNAFHSKNSVNITEECKIDVVLVMSDEEIYFSDEEGNLLSECIGSSEFADAVWCENMLNAGNMIFIPCEMVNTTIVEPILESNTTNATLPICTQSALAAATYCSTDQYDRPIAGMIHYCIGSDFFQPENIQQNIITTMHELAHVLGFNSQSLAHFRFPDGSPMTPRNDQGDVTDTLVKCPGTDSFSMNIPLPSSDVLQFHFARGVRVAQVVTPTVRQIARNQFDCQYLPGAELEGGDAEQDICIGEHWNRRLFRDELLNPVVDGISYSVRVSPITLAYFKDSGWYHVEVSQASNGAPWGRAAGCDFVYGKCVDSDGDIEDGNESFFCKDGVESFTDSFSSAIHGCSSDFTKKAACSLVDHEDETIPDEFQYFSDSLGPSWAGSDPELDYCPVFTGFSNGQCNDPQNTDLRVHASEVFGVKNSRCVFSEVHNQKTSLCLPIACVIKDQSLRLKVNGKWVKCLYEGQTIELQGSRNNDHVVCPHPSRTCPSFYCPRNCLDYDNGVCDYESGKCLCPSADVNPIETEDENPAVYTSSSKSSDADMIECQGSVEDEPEIVFYENINIPIYFTSAELLVDDYSGPNIFEELSPAQSSFLFIAIGVAMVVFIILSVIFTKRALKKSTERQIAERRQVQKQKMVANVLVQMRVEQHRPRGLTSRILSRLRHNSITTEGTQATAAPSVLSDDDSMISQQLSAVTVSDKHSPQVGRSNDGDSSTTSSLFRSYSNTSDNSGISIYPEI
eukprot:CAMPEP_0178973084 /NCGR_PEP_ID=MMETSP0789-20121207/21487_1 /TAXON_ID=3005 /ORGANISM="Rhizosolenia setigera, Strain CCMP 1694" /LENGTH=1065 /DNA_ID=CAMNT_0020660833 /DNA_START=23 /DNA_END=3220 /DNA_ORIENTATION=+